MVATTSSVGLGLLIELIQAPLPYRDAQAADVAVDVLGAALGLAAFSAVAAWRAWRPRWHRG
jgi:VanZ family protein